MISLMHYRFVASRRPGAPHDEGVLDVAVLADEGAQADDGVFDGCARPHHTAVA